MNKLNFTLSCLIAFSSVVYAETFSVVNNIFEENVNLDEMLENEMKDTKGQWVPAVVWLGSAIGGSLAAERYYRGYKIDDYDWNTGKFIGNIATGSIIGGAFGAAGAGTGTIYGRAIWTGKGAVLNNGTDRFWQR